MTIKFSLNYVANHIIHLENSITNKKYFWKYVNEKRNNYDIPNLMKYNDASSDNTEEITNYFKEFFSSVYTNTIPFWKKNQYLIDV
nr:unnamed protein product [Callosobruchus analis]